MSKNSIYSSWLENELSLEIALDYGIKRNDTIDALVEIC